MGGSSGLGKGMAIEFAKQGCNLALCARRFENLEKLKDELYSINPNIDVYIRSLDVNDHDAVFEVFDAFKADMGTLDRVIVNAGMGKGERIYTSMFGLIECNSSFNFSKFSKRLAHRAKLHPCLANSIAIPLPRPELPPVIRILRLVVIIVFLMLLWPYYNATLSNE